MSVTLRVSDIDFRIMYDQASTDESIAVGSIELYVR